MRRLDRFDVGSAATVLPGVTMQSGGPRGERLLFVRGFEARQVPIFIDGIPVYVPYNGNIDIGRFAANGLARIDVSKAWTSLLYGANTMGGSVNLVTRRPTDALEADLRLYSEFDSRGDRSATLGDLFLGTAQDQWYAQATLTGMDRSHFRIGEGFTPMATENGGRRENSEASDVGLQLRLGFTPNATDEYAISYFNQQGLKQTPPYAGNRLGLDPARFWRWPDYDKESVYFISRTALSGTEDLRLRLYWDSFQNTLQSFDNARYATRTLPFAFNSLFDDYTLGASADLGSTRIAGHTLRASANYKTDIHHEIDNDGALRERMQDETWGVAVEDRYQLAQAWTVAASAGWQRQRALRADNRIETRRAGRVVGQRIEGFPTPTNDAFNVQFGAFHAIDASHNMHAVISRRTRFATMQERFSFRLGSAIPNPGLEPESSLAFELGVDGTDGPVSWRVAAHVAGLEDAIQQVIVARALCPPDPRVRDCFQLRNIGRATHRGVELSGRWDIAPGWALDGNYAFLDRENRTRPDVQPINVPAHFGLASLEWSGERVDIITSVQAESSRLSRPDGLRIADGFMLGHVKGIWHALKDTDLEFSVLNLADTRYEFIEGFQEAGRTFLVGFHYRR